MIQLIAAKIGNHILFMIASILYHLCSSWIMRQYHFHYKIQLKYNFSLCFECFICVCLAIYCVRYCYTFRSNSIHAELNRVDITQINGCVRLNMQLILAIISFSMNPITYFSVLHAIQFWIEKSMSCY